MASASRNCNRRLPEAFVAVGLRLLDDVLEVFLASVVHVTMAEFPTKAAPESLESPYLDYKVSSSRSWPNFCR